MCKEVTLKTFIIYLFHWGRNTYTSAILVLQIYQFDQAIFSEFISLLWSNSGLWHYRDSVFKM